MSVILALLLMAPTAVTPLVELETRCSQLDDKLREWGPIVIESLDADSPRLEMWQSCYLPEPEPKQQTPSRPKRFYSSGVEQWRALVSAYFPGDQIDTAMCIMRYESQGNPNADNPKSTANGLFQILGSLWAPHFGVSQEDLFQPELNVRLASKIWRSQGWGAWTTYRLCH